MASVAAIIPAYNRAKSVIEALESVALQTRGPDRLVVVDDGSTDQTPWRVEQWIAQHGRGLPAMLVQQPNQGVSVARNRGAAEAAECELLAFLDSDDMWPPDYLQRMTAAMAAAPEAVAATSDRQDIDLQTHRIVNWDLSHLAHDTTRRLVVEGAPWTSNTVIRASHFHALEGYDPAMRTSQDWQLMLRLSLRGPWLHVPGAPVIYRMGLSATSGEEQNLSRTYSDARLRRVRMLETFLLREGGRRAVPARVWRRALAERWYKAGKQLLEQGQRREAVRCFARSLRWRPMQVGAWWKAVRAVGMRGRGR